MLFLFGGLSAHSSRHDRAISAWDPLAKTPLAKTMPGAEGNVHASQAVGGVRPSLARTSGDVSFGLGNLRGLSRGP